MRNLPVRRLGQNAEQRFPREAPQKKGHGRAEAPSGASGVEAHQALTQRCDEANAELGERLEELPMAGLLGTAKAMTEL